MLARKRIKEEQEVGAASPEPSHADSGTYQNQGERRMLRIGAGGKD